MKLKRKNMKIIENVGYLNRLFLYGVFCTLFPLVGTSCSTTKNLIDANDIDYIKFLTIIFIEHSEMKQTHRQMDSNDSSLPHCHFG